MARKLGLGWSMMLCACALVTGCQSGAGTRLAGNKTTKNDAIAKQGALPPPMPIGGANNPGFRSNQGASPAGFSTSSPNAFPTQPGGPVAAGSNFPGLPSAGPQAPGAPMLPPPNHGNVTTFTQPNVPMLPPPPSPNSGFANPGFSPVTPQNQ